MVVWLSLSYCIILVVQNAENILADQDFDSIAIEASISERLDLSDPSEPSYRSYRYRSFDGSYNNLKNPSWGTPNKPYARFFKDSYSDGKHAMPRSKSNESLASAREISLEIFIDRDIKDPIWYLITLQWGQIIAHDLSHTAGLSKPASCCSRGQFTEKDKTDPRCAAIPIPEDDPYNGPEGNKCYNFYRTKSTEPQFFYDSDKLYEPITDVTSFMDLSPVYGSTNRQARDLRAFKGGRLTSVTRNGQEWLPQSHDAKSTCFNVSSQKEPCYRAGDSRVNQNTQLSVLQNILLREHNRIADQLCGSINRHWNDERCFQEARKILIGMVQHINYYEFLPILIGRDHMIKHKLITPDVEGYVNDYDSNVNPQVLNEFATCAYRNYHSSIVGYLRLYLENRETTGSLRISDHMNKPSIIEDGENFVRLSRGLTSQFQEAVDRYFTSEMTQFIFKGGDKLGQDLRSLDIQRSRDHGVGTYVNALIACGLSDPKTFEDLEKYIPASLVSLLKKVYQYVEDVETIVAGSLEDLLPDTLAGPTFQCIMTEQFRRTRLGDSCFYENGHTSCQPFSLEQLNSIRKGAKMANLLCNNVNDFKQIQPQAFLRISDNNTLVPCSELTQVNLTLWKEIV